MAWISSTIMVPALFQNFAAFRSGQQDVEGFGSGDQNMRRTGEHRAALVGQGIAGSNGGANLRKQNAALAGELKNFAERSLQIFLNVVA